MKRSKATDIKPDTRKIVLERDHYQCVVCGSYNTLTLAHIYINRSHGGLGIPTNLATLCMECHHHLDNGKKHKQDVIRKEVETYMELHYGKPDLQLLKYKKWLNDTLE